MHNVNAVLVEMLTAGKGYATYRETLHPDARIGRDDNWCDFYGRGMERPDRTVAPVA